MSVVDAARSNAVGSTKDLALSSPDKALFRPSPLIAGHDARRLDLLDLTSRKYISFYKKTPAILKLHNCIFLW
jgi:hypothetical protein